MLNFQLQKNGLDMPLLTSILPRIPKIVALYSSIKFEFERFRLGKIDERGFLQATEDAKTALLTKTQELVDIVGGTTDDTDLVHSCADLTVRIGRQANGIAHGLVSPVNRPAVAQSLSRINSNILVLESRLCLHYEQIAAQSESKQMKAECYKKALDLIRKHPPPILEDDFEEYRKIAKGISIAYSNDERAHLNKKMLQLPGMPKFLTSLMEIEKRDYVLGLIRRYDETDSTTINPLPEQIRELLPCIGILDYLNFLSEEEVRSDFVRFFRNGNWLELYAFLMLDRAGCSTRLLNVTLSQGNVLLETDVLALYSNNLIIFESKDRAFSNDLTTEDVTDITRKVEKIAKLGNASIRMNYIVNISDENKENVRSKIEEIFSSKGLEVNTIFTDNVGSIDNIVANIRGCLR